MNPLFNRFQGRNDAKKTSVFLPGVPVHIVQRGHSRNPVFFETQDYSTYAYWLKKACQKYQVAVHSFVLMTNHVHFLVTPTEGKHVSLLMQFIGRHYVPYFNNKYGKSGSIWEGRYKASLVQEETYFLTVMRYIELNPVRANMVELPSHYHWSSFCHNSGERDISFITPHQIYKALGNNKQSRHEEYQKLFDGHVDHTEMKRIRDAWQTGTPLGNTQFRDRVESQLRCNVGVARRGRPAKFEIYKGL